MKNSNECCFILFHTLDIITIDRLTSNKVLANNQVANKLEFSLDLDLDSSEISEIPYSSDSDFSSNDHSNSSISMHINSIDQIEAASDSDRYIEDNMQTEANNSHNNCKRKSNEDTDSIIDNKNEEVNISCFCGITHTRNLFYIQCGKCRN